MSQTARVARVATAGLLPFLAQAGADADRIMGPAGIDAGQLDEATEGSISLAAYVEMMQRAALVSGQDDFGLRYGRQFPASCHGLVGNIALAAPSIGMALRQFADLFPLHQGASEVRLVAETGLLRLEYRILDWRIFDRRQDAELSLAMFQNLLRQAYGPGFALEEVHFEHPEPGERAAHAATFNAPVFFGQRTNALIFRPGDLRRPMPGADAAAFSRRLAEAFLRRSPHGVAPLPDRVRAEIRSRLPEGAPPIEDVAASLGVARWTLQRRLGETGLTYAGAVQEVRRCLAESYLRQPHLSISCIAQLLGYAELSPFSRACKRWFGASPEQMRATGF
ncbi:MAG TPA: AraC family transcriptional regulator [Acidocella sp.]|jgi:AraC-like DNA-binding protein|uniref:AraC-like transcriptional regulator QhpR n=1 Tax=Acidocella sp. TaxID=50710 RepID=UPI002C3B3847|nr:AraC family transcriptional regulator [Acidocella sp.]HVE23603.1 AraC family transcriptional regulator [Acidocella sp.]